MRLKSKNFAEGERIPARFTCDGEDVSPELSWENVPEGIKSFALSVTDPDAPGGEFIHWLVHDIPKGVRNIAEGTLPKGAKQVRNDFGREGYGGPCPPSGTHRYIFTLSALDVEKLGKVDRRNFFKEVEKHALSKATLKGLYGR